MGAQSVESVLLARKGGRQAINGGGTVGRARHTLAPAVLAGHTATGGCGPSTAAANRQLTRGAVTCQACAFMEPAEWCLVAATSSWT